MSEELPREAEGAPAPAETRAPASPPGIAYNQRVFVAGMTGSGKSELLNHLFTVLRCQRLMLDCKDECRVAGVAPTSAVEAIDWSAPVIHYVPRRADRDELEQLFAACYARRHLVVAAHELADLCDFHPTATPTAVRSYLNKGRARGLGMLGASQQPVSVPKHALTEAGHIFLFVPRLSPEHHRALARTMGMPENELGRALDDLHARHGDHAFLWWNRRTRELRESRPLPAAVRRTSAVKLVDVG